MHPKRAELPVDPLKSMRNSIEEEYIQEALLETNEAMKKQTVLAILVSGRIEYWCPHHAHHNDAFKSPVFKMKNDDHLHSKSHSSFPAARSLTRIKRTQRHSHMVCHEEVNREGTSLEEL
ncbi:hypothetical protein JOB18_005315 [Solea senegalensis]|uniref:Uncharacterized protein n=1 Tax=Solea senegalensis TaxID=28829 RepID=A0AAV6PRV3_SOLSE|nr:hypothetical protein JOB18_005315 [Solea senegalensis]